MAEILDTSLDTSLETNLNTSLDTNTAANMAATLDTSLETNTAANIVTPLETVSITGSVALFEQFISILQTEYPNKWTDQILNRLAIVADIHQALLTAKASPIWLEATSPDIGHKVEMTIILAAIDAHTMSKHFVEYFQSGKMHPNHVPAAVLHITTLLIIAVAPADATVALTY